jgi:hypothetical protein
MVIIGCVWRYNFAGMNCSGDYLEVDATSPYIPSSGKLINVYIILTFVGIVLSCCCCIAFCIFGAAFAAKMGL